MKKNMLMILFSLVIFVSQITFVFPEQGKGNGHQYGGVKQQLQTYFDRLEAQEYFSGSVLVARQGKILLHKGYGMANYEKGIPNHPNTVFSIASFTKAFASMSIMMLKERSLLSIEDTVDKYFPGYPDGDRITLHYLLNMSAGIYNYTDNPAVWENAANFHYPEQLLQYFENEPPLFEPGADFSYCNSCYVLLGMIVEKVSGKTFRDFIKINILDPLKMNHTSYDPYEVDFPHKAIGYDDITVDPPVVTMYLNPTLSYTAGGMCSTTGDLYKWDQALYTEKLVSVETLQQMFTPGPGDYGYGWYSDYLYINGQPHKQIWYWGAYVGFHSYISRLVDDRVTIIILLNTSPLLGTQDELKPIVMETASIIFKGR